MLSYPFVLIPSAWSTTQKMRRLSLILTFKLTLREIFVLFKSPLQSIIIWVLNLVKAFLQTENLGNRLRACKPWTWQCGKIGLKWKRVPNVQNNLAGYYLTSVLYNKSVQREICRLSSSLGFLEFIKLLFSLFQSLVCEVFIHKYIYIFIQAFAFRVSMVNGSPNIKAMRSKKQKYMTTH